MSKTIILIGKTGSGKSTLANVISGTNKFWESKASVSGTKEIQKEEFIEKNVSYAVIDTVGMGDTKLKKEEVLDKIAEAVYLAREGVSQILFVTDGRFDQYEMVTYNLLRTIIFDEHVTKHTTIVRTRFEDFEDEEECQADIEKMLAEKELSEIVKSCQKNIVHVNNSSLSSKYGKEEREESRRIVLEHLWEKEKCQNQETYKPQKLQELSDEIFEFMEEKLRKRKELEEKRKKAEKSKVSKKQVSAIESNKSESKNTLSEDAEDEKDELNIETTEKEEQQAENNNEEEIKDFYIESSEDFYIEDSSDFTIKLITTSEDELKELEESKNLMEEIQEKEGLIRQKVLSHIFNSYNEISQVAGGNIFINTIIGDNDNSPNANKLSIDELQKQKEQLEKKLLEKKCDQSREELEKEINQKEQELLGLKKQLLGIKTVTEKWQKRRFDIQQANEWANVLSKSFDPKYDVAFCAWLRDSKNLRIEEALRENVEQLREEHRLCPECHKDNDRYGWCHSCNVKHFQNEFDKWTSEDGKIDEFIWQVQLNANKHKEILEWISFDRLENVTYLAKGGFSTVYKAKWLDGSIRNWDIKNRNWERKGESVVALKSLDNSTNKNEFLQEIKNQLKFRGKKGIAIYGITKNPTSNEYMMVMKYAKQGSLRNLLNNRFKELTWRKKYDILLNIVNGLRNIHEMGLMHKSIHSGNIVNQTLTSSYIIDFGSCKPVTENDQENIYGVIPYMAPETLSKGEYTQASDIYSFGMIILEVLTSYPPYYNKTHNSENLVMDICKGLKPEIKCKIPQYLKEIMEKCWNFEPLNRPTAKELLSQLENYFYNDNEIRKQVNKQVNAANKSNKNFIQYDPNEKHPEAIYTPPLSPFIKPRKVEDDIHDEKQWGFEIPDDIVEENEISGEEYQSQIEIPPKK